MTHVRQRPPRRDVPAVTAVLSLLGWQVIAGSVSASGTVRASSIAG